MIEIHGISITATRTELRPGHTRRVCDDVNCNSLIEVYSIAGMAHGVPIASSPIAVRCGPAGPFFHDVSLSSTHRIAHFWNLEHGRIKAQSAEAASIIGPDRTGAGECVIEVAARVGGQEEETETVSSKLDKTRLRRPSFDPNNVIAGAFKAAGLPVPELPLKVPRTSSYMDPGLIVDAALKAAGLRR